MIRTSSDNAYDDVVVGGAAAGVGVGVTLRYAGIEQFAVLERHTVGSSFALWPAETRFITPSYTTNSIGMLDLNSIVMGTSPAYSLGVEHPTGQDYAKYLRAVAHFFDVPVQQNTDVLQVTTAGDGFRIVTAGDTLHAKHVIWAAGEFQYPRLSGCSGSHLCRHTSTIASYEELDGDNFIVVGGYESGVDAAYHPAYSGKRERLFDANCPWESESSDPSIAPSPFTFERMHEGPFVERRDDGSLLLSEHDESTTVPGVFLWGPAVCHHDHVVCFIFKYRQRFAVVAKAIATSLGLTAENLRTIASGGCISMTFPAVASSVHVDGKRGTSRRIWRATQPAGQGPEHRVARANCGERLLDWEHADSRGRIRWGLAAVVCCICMVVGQYRSVCDCRS